ncbi:hypothetical protein L210DRAFT_3648035 [Boletus edulis BED1]|uniref:Fungal-type protein kinase domain-containing protein n=1 Tax=Boletus edulis BED1 TaxID=1328754 RepID=A0AAD4BNU9_BOLED|nr:hypothetical protein L210DRAFT_3648035 [Boletus edulis BED1]
MRPPRNKYSTVDVTYKTIGSLPPPREGRGVATMDKFVSIELQGKVVNERRDAAARRSLGFFLDLIFASFTKEFADVALESLIVPLSSIPSAARRSMSSESHNNRSGSESIELYDRENKRWRWNLPLIDSPSAIQTGSESSDIPSNLQSLSSEQQVALFFNCITDAVTASRANLKAGKFFTKGSHRRQWLANWSKTSLPGSTGYSRKPDLVLVDNDAMSHDEITWLSPKVIAEYTKETFQPASRIGKTMDTKAYLVLVDQPWRRFILGLSIANCDLRVHFYDHSGGAISPAFNIHADAQHFFFIIAALAFGCRASIGFDLTVEIHPPPLKRRRRSAREIASSAKETDDDPDPTEEQSILPLTKTPDPIHHDPLSPPRAEPLPPPPTPNTFPPPSSPNPDLPPVIGKIRVGDIYYEIIDILFSSTGFIGRGTICYLARYEGVYYVIKDHWVRDLDQDGICDPMMIHEARMMEYVKDIDGVPKLHGAWVVEAEEGVPDSTSRYREEKYRKMQSPRTHVRLAMTPCARPLTMFKSKKELIICIRGVLGIIQQALERGVLHRDCSLFNTMIEDLPDGASRGFLLDWEFAVEITKRGEYSVGGTGTLPFMSVNILRQLESAFAKSAAVTAQTIRKTASLTRVFINRPISICHTYADDVESLLYVLIWVIVMYDGPLGHERRDIGHEKTFLSLWSEKAASDLAIARHAKFSFLIDSDRKILDDAVTPYCSNLIPLVHQWRALHKQALLTDTVVDICDIARVLDKFIAGMLEEHPAEMAYTLNHLTARHPPESPLPAPPVATPSGSSKRLRDDVRSMGNPPLPSKRFKSGL